MKTPLSVSLSSVDERTFSIRPLLPILALASAVLFWGGSFSAMHVALNTLNPWSVIWCRMIIALICIAPFTKKLIQQSNYQKGDWIIFIPTFLFQPCLYFLFESYVLKFTTSSQAGVISAFVPMMVTVGAWIFFSEKISINTLLGMVLSITGVYFLTIFQSESSTATNPLLGNLLELIAMICAATNMLLIKRLSKRYNPWALTAMQVVTGSIFFLPGGYILLTYSIESINLTLFLILTFLGMIVTLGAFGLYNWGISQIPASSASAYINLIPVIAILLGWILLGEVLNTLQIIATIAVILGVILSQVSIGRNEGTL